MRTLKITSAVLLLAACVTQSPPPPAAALQAASAPQTVAVPVTETLHGVTLTDPYRWLEDQDAPATREWIQRQNAWTDAVLGNRPEAGLFAPRLEQLLGADQVKEPVWRNGRYFFTRRPAGQDLYSIYMRVGLDGPDQLLIDPAPLSPDHTTNVDIVDVSSDGSHVVYSVRKGGADEIEIRTFDVIARRDVGAPLATSRYYGADLAPDNATLYFTRMHPTGTEGPRVFRRAVSGGEEAMLFGDGYGHEKILFAGLSDDGRYLLMHVFHGSSPKKTEIYLDDLSDAASIHTVVNDLDFRSTADFAGDTLIIKTNWDAPNERVLTVAATDPRRARWKEIVPENPKAAIQGMTAAGGRVYVRYLEDVKPRIIGYDLAGARRDEIAFEQPGYLADMSGSWETPMAFFTFSSMAIPGTVYQHEVASGKRSVFATLNVPVDPSRFTVEQVWYPSKDGARVPMFLIYRKGLQRNGKNPTWLTGYGGFMQSQLPGFSVRALPWAEQGGVYALANLRGGGEFGEEWHHAGMLDQKQNTFDDFIAAGEYLIREGFTSPQHLGIAGTSNGGLLVTAAATQRPDLFGAVLCRYPLVDMLRFHKFLVGSFWVPEYGSADDPEQFRWLAAYSPYQRVVQGTKYPATLFVTGDADTRVAPLHARKMTALMQAASASNEPILLRYHVAFGHSGGEPLGVQVKNLSEEIGFMWWQLKELKLLGC